TRKWALLRCAHVLLLPSYSENFGMVVLEAMAVGCPVVVTSKVGLAEVVKLSGAGLVVNGDANEIAEATVWLEHNEAERARMSQAGKHAAVDQFSWASAAAKMENLYVECASRQ